MARIKLKTVFLVIGLLTSPLVFKGRCEEGKEKELNYIVFPKVYFSSNAEQVNTFLSKNDFIEWKDIVKWHHLNNSCYTFIDSFKMTWEDAANACGSIGDGIHLAFIESEQESRELSVLVVDMGVKRHTSWWIGLNDKDQEGIWKWYNVSMGYTNWRNGEPNREAEDCGDLFWDGDNAAWRDVQCSLKLYFICETDIKSDA